MTGFIAMQRDALDHPLLQDGNRFRAWFWLVSNAAWKATQFDIRGTLVPIKRGQLCVSVRQMADAWGMSKSAVDRFLTRLETETMIEREAGHGRLVLTVCNYAKYQDLGETERDTSGTPSGTPAGHQRDLKEQGNKGTIIPNGMKTLSGATDAETVLVDWAAMAKPLSLSCWEKLSPKRKRIINSRLKEHGFDAVKRAIERVPKSAFLRGETGNWNGANLDFLMRPDTIPKILEGQYDDRTKPEKPASNSNGAIDNRDGAMRALDRRLGLDGAAGSPGRRHAGQSHRDSPLRIAAPSGG